MKRIIGMVLLLALTGCGAAPAEPASVTDSGSVPVVAEPAAGSANDSGQAAEVLESQPPADVVRPPADEVLTTIANAGEPEGFPFEFNGQTIYVGLSAEPIVQALGEPMNYFEAPSCAFQGIDKTYFYSGFELHTFPQNGEDYVLAVLFTDDSVETPEGVYLGMPLADALAVYGADYTQDGEQYTYLQGKGSLRLFDEDGTVAEVSYHYETGE